MVKISVIMPVYNDELYLEEAIESVNKQTLKDLELICVDDGSSDNSLNILKKLEKKYDFIKVFSHENQGVAATRNFAMDNSIGEYFAFLDSDDMFMDNDCLEKLYNVAKKNNANMVAGNLKIWNEDGTFTPFKYLKYFTKEEIILPENYGVPFSFTKAIFKRKFIQDNEIYFPLLTKGEDPVFLAEILSKLDCIYAVPTDVYAYRYIDGSVKYNTYKNYYDQVLHYKLVFDNMSDSKFDKHTHEFKYYLLSLFGFMGVERLEPTLKAVREVFSDNPKILRQCEEYFYFKFKNNKKLSHLVTLEKNPNKPRISVIVPIYNDENNINSVKSILNQTLEDIEIICIDDGSIDNSLNILNSFNDERLKIIHQEENQGYANSKKIGLNESKGEYIYFHEPGINISKTYLERLYINAMVNDSDIVLSKYSTFDKLYLDCIKPKFNLINHFEGVNFNKFVFNYQECKLSVLNAPFSLSYKLYKKEFLDKYDDLDFNSDLAFEDVMFHIKSILKAFRISFVKNREYKSNFNSPSRYYDSLISKDILNITDNVEIFLKENGYYQELYDEFILFKFTNIVNNMVFVHDEQNYLFAKDELLNLNFTNFKKINQDTLIRYYNIIKSNSLNEFKKYEFKNNKINLNQKYKSLKAINAKLKKENEKLTIDNSKLKKVNNDFYASNSWKISKPLRKIKKII